MIKFENISFSYKKGENVLAGFNMEIPDGGRVCLFGKSGCGKTTVLRLAMGLSRPGSGRITGTEGLTVSAVFQEDRLIPWKTALENVALFADRAPYENAALSAGTLKYEEAGTEAAASNRAVTGAKTVVSERSTAGASDRAGADTAETVSGHAADLLRELGLDGVLHSLPGELSGGMKRRTALARALAHSFDLLVLDEPFTGLDDAAKRKAIALVSREAEGKMLLLATHDLQEAEALGADIIQL